MADSEPSAVPVALRVHVGVLVGNDARALGDIEDDSLGEPDRVRVRVDWGEEDGKGDTVWVVELEIEGVVEEVRV